MTRLARVVWLVTALCLAGCVGDGAGDACDCRPGVFDDDVADDEVLGPGRQRLLVDQQDDRIDITGLADLAPEQPVKMVLHHGDGSSDEVMLQHTMTEEQVSWFKAGSALNKIKAGA